MGGRGASSGIAKGIKLEYHNDNMTAKQIADKKTALIGKLNKLADATTERLKNDRGEVDYKYNVSVSDWKNYGKDRTYFKISEKRAGSRHNTEYDFGYYDNKTGDYIPKKWDVLKDNKL